MILMLVVLAWSAVLLLVAGLCAGARLGDVAHVGEPPAAEPAYPPVSWLADAGARETAPAAGTRAHEDRAGARVPTGLAA